MTLPTIKHIHHPGCQTFFFGPRQWCATYALQLLAADPTLAEEFTADITGLDDALGINPVPEGKLQLFRVQIDKNIAMASDTSVPPLVVRVTSDATGEDLGPMIIDGWHRLYRLRRGGVTQTQALMLSADVEKAKSHPNPDHVRSTRMTFNPLYSQVLAVVGQRPESTDPHADPDAPEPAEERARRWARFVGAAQAVADEHPVEQARADELREQADLWLAVPGTQRWTARCPKGVGHMFVPDVASGRVHLDEGDGSGMVDVVCNGHECAVSSVLYFTPNDDEYRRVFGHGFDEDQAEFDLDEMIAAHAVVLVREYEAKRGRKLHPDQAIEIMRIVEQGAAALRSWGQLTPDLDKVRQYSDRLASDGHTDQAARVNLAVSYR